jgi:isopenicillin N synthase-like dioxygenase
MSEMRAEYTTKEPGGIPVIDFSPWACQNVNDKDDADEDKKTEVSKQIVEAFCTIGFIIVVNHGIRGDDTPDGGVTARAFRASKDFFALDKDMKLAFGYQSNESNRGYIAMGQEKLDAELPDLKETFDMGYEGEKEYQNRWPMHELPSFKETMLELFDEYDHLHLNILRALARGMGLPSDDYFTPLCRYETCVEITDFVPVITHKRHALHKNKTVAIIRTFAYCIILHAIVLPFVSVAKNVEVYIRTMAP